VGRIFAGIDLGGTSIHAAAVRDGTILTEAGCKTPRDGAPAAVIAQIAELVERLQRETAGKGGLAGVCLGAPGAVDTEAGVVLTAPNLGWSDVPVARELSARTGLDVVLENDVTIGGVGEHVHGAGRDARHMVAIFVGTGVGGALIVNGKPLRGGRGAAGEVGHMVSVPGGRECGCGQRGCFEAYASRTAMERIVHERISEGRASVVPELMAAKGKTRMSSSVVEAALDRGDALMREVMGEVQAHLARLVADLVNAVDPEVVVVGGGIAARLGARFVDPIARLARPAFLRQDAVGAVRIVPAELGDHSGTIGAAVVAEARLGTNDSVRI
jgi:glucokinase